MLQTDNIYYIYLFVTMVCYVAFNTIPVTSWHVLCQLQVLLIHLSRHRLVSNNAITTIIPENQGGNNITIIYILFDMTKPGEGTININPV